MVGAALPYSQKDQMPFIVLIAAVRGPLFTSILDWLLHLLGCVWDGMSHFWGENDK